MFYYQIYGCNIASEIELPVGTEGVRKNLDKSKINLHFIIDDQSIKSPSTELFNDYVKFEEGKHRYVNSLTGIYDIDANGTYINFSRFTTCKSFMDIGACFVGIVFPYILQIKGIIPIHASGIVSENDAWGIMAGPGVGKSTTQISLLKKGIKFFTDDVIPLSISESGVLAYPGYPALKLGEQSLTLADENQFTSVSLLTEKSTKYICALNEESICTKPLKLKGLFLLKPHEDTVKGIEISKLNGYEKLINLMANVFTLTIINKNTSTQYMNVFSSKVFNDIPVYSIKYPRGFSYLDNVTNRIIEVMKCEHVEGEKVV